MIDALRQVWKTAEEWYKFFVESGKLQLRQLEQEKLQAFSHRKDMEVKKLVMNANPLGDMKNYQIIKFLQHKIDDFKPIPSLIADL